MKSASVPDDPSQVPPPLGPAASDAKAGY